MIVQHPRIHTKALPKGRTVLRGDRPSRKGRKGKCKGKGGKSSQLRNPSGFAFHAAEENFACGYTAAEDGSEPFADPAYVDDEDYSGDEADAYNAYDEDDYDEEYDAFADACPWNSIDSVSAYVADEWNKKWTVEDPLEASELDSEAFVAQQASYLGATPEECMNDPES